MSYVEIGLTKFKTLADENQFSFVCPIFNANVRMSGCMKLRDFVWEGKEIEKRKGCQVCMKANKCPMDNIVKRVGNANYGDPYGSVQPKQGSLRKDDLERILKVMVPDHLLEKSDCSPTERALIETANDRIRKQIGSSRTSAVEDFEDEEIVEVKPKRRASPKPKTSAADEAAMRGDISAAINTVTSEAA